MKDDKLGKLLREWDSNITHPQRTRTEKQRILERVKENALGKRDHVPQPAPNVKYFVYAMAIVASLGLTCLLCFQLSKRSASPIVNADDLASLSSEDMMELRTIFSEIDQLFPDEVRWVSKIDDKLEIKTGDCNSIASATERILIRYVVLTKRNGSWERIHVAEIVTFPGEEVIFQGANSGHLWTHQASEDVFALDCSIKLNANAKSVSIVYFGGIERGVQQSVEIKGLNEGVYKIYRSVTRI